MRAAIDSGSTNASVRDAGWAVFNQRADVNSFVDMYLLHELFGNQDCGWSSFFFSKDAGADAKVFATAPWDFDATVGLSQIGTNGRYIGANPQTAPQHRSQLFRALTRNSDFNTLVRARWNILRPLIVEALRADNNNGIMSDTFLDDLQDSMTENFTRWSGHGHSGDTWRNGSGTISDPNRGNAQYVRNWLTTRAGNMAGFLN
jgi:hypothetical protein